jgi:pyrroline-5-carboxylate reductase
MSVLVIVGGGRMGEALVGGLLAAGRAPSSLTVVEVVAARRAELGERFPGVGVVDSLPDRVEDALIAVKPGDVGPVGRALAAAGVQRVLSIAAGVTTGAIEASVGPGVAVVRAMPNTPALVGQGAAAIAGGAGAGPADLAWATEILAAVGTVEVVGEKLLDAVTGLSGSGPAYLFLVAEALIEAGVLNGLPRPSADALTRQLFTGVAAMLAVPASEPAQLRAQVTSPGGTTAAGLRALEDRAVRAALLAAVTAATERSRELG